MRTVRAPSRASVHGRDLDTLANKHPLVFSTHISAITPISRGAYKPVSTVALELARGIHEEKEDA